MTNINVTKIEFKDGSCLELNSDDIVIFVGPNNAGKSRTLKEIYDSFNSAIQNLIVKDIEFKIFEEENLEITIENYSNIKVNKDSKQYKGLNFSFSTFDIAHYKQKNKIKDTIIPFFISKIETEDRLKLCKPVDVINRDDPKTHPFHYLANDIELKNAVSTIFEKAFGNQLQLEITNTKQNFFRIGRNIQTLNNVSFDENIANYSKIMNSYPKVHEQGDGIKSFVGILIHLLIENYSLFLIDEPEAFLHPPQARILGNEMPNLLKNRQAFISTHNSSLIKGLLETAPSRVKIIRITREGNNNFISPLENEEIDKIWKDPLLKYSNILDSLFFKNVVVCESDADCQFYSIILSQLKENRNKFPESLFVYSSTKFRLKVIAGALKSLNIDFRIIADIDILRKDDNEIQKLYVTCGGFWNQDLEDALNKFNQYFEGEDLTIEKGNLKNLFEVAIDAKNKDKFNGKDISDIKQSVKLEDRWQKVKRDGIGFINQEEIVEAFNYLNEELKKIGIFIVIEGELESFIKIGRQYHGPQWVNKILKTYPDFSVPEYNTIKNFVQSLNI